MTHTFRGRIDAFYKDGDMGLTYDRGGLQFYLSMPLPESENFLVGDEVEVAITIRKPLAAVKAENDALRADDPIGIRDNWKSYDVGSRSVPGLRGKE